ncbi:hypothetical protein BJ944DRAFT_271256 [Cunninghamella echinulata]|nr:hypothetical protein BJ944DRAFT_271256 [Cunninghamella echinulata]
MATNRPEYRDPHFPRSVKVYTVAQESQHIIIKNIPALSGEEAIIQDLLKQCGLYGDIIEWKLLEKQKDQDPFTNILYVHYSNIDQGRLAKNKLSGHIFYASRLQVNYAPEHDSVDDIRLKIQNRQISVYKRLQQLAKETNRNARNHKKRKRLQQQQSFITTAELSPPLAIKNHGSPPSLTNINFHHKVIPPPPKIEQQALINKKQRRRI